VIGEALHLPPDRFELFAPARATADERERILGLIEARIRTRKPTAYLLGRIYAAGVPFHVDERVIVPRSYLGETRRRPLPPTATRVSALWTLTTGTRTTFTHMVKAVTTEVAARRTVSQLRTRRREMQLAKPAREKSRFQKPALLFWEKYPDPQAEIAGGFDFERRTARHSQRPNRGKSLMAFPLIS
jgi:hypothetical protein